MVGKSRSNSSHIWLKRQRNDIYTAQAKAQGYRSRAAFKILEIHQRDKIFKQGMRVVDLGAAPGGFSQVAANQIGRHGQVIALDKLPIDSLLGVDILQGDFLDPEVFKELQERLDGKPVDLVLSDMAPNMSGMKAVDNPRTMVLAEMALDFAEQVLVEGGSLLVKVFQGEGFQTYSSMLKERFDKLYVRKPKASRKESNEVYLLAKGYISSMRGSYIERYA